MAEVAARALEEFCENLKPLMVVGEKTLEEAKVLTQIAAKNVKISIFEKIMKDIEIEKTAGDTFTMGGKTVGEIHKLIREGSLIELSKLAKSEILVTQADEAKFMSLVEKTPEFRLKQLDIEASKFKEKFEHLNLKFEELSNASSKVAADIKQVEHWSLKYIKAGTPLVLTIGSITAGAVWIHQALQDRRGCFLFSTINNTQSSCKIRSFSCMGDVTSKKECENDNAYSGVYNDTIMLMTIAQLPKTNQLRKDMCKALGLKEQEEVIPVKNILTTNFTKLTTFLRSKSDSFDSLTVDICKITHPDVEGGKIPPCRMCSPTADARSTEFVDLRQVGKNYTFRCISDPTVIDLLVDVGQAIGQNLFDAFKSFWSGFTKYLIYAAVALVILIVFVVIIKESFRRQGNRYPNDNIYSSDSSPLLSDRSDSRETVYQSNTNSPNLSLMSSSSQSSGKSNRSIQSFNSYDANYALERAFPNGRTLN